MFDQVSRASLMKHLLATPSDELAKLRAQTDIAKSLISTVALPSTETDLVYTSLPAPCRIFDSRASSGYQGEGTGPLAAGAPVAISVTGNCGIPFPSATSVVLNFVAAGPAGNGNLRAWPWDSSNPAAPNASVLNFTGGVNIANGIIVPICDIATATAGACSKDLLIAPFVHATDVVIDATGYLAPPVSKAVVTTMTSANWDAAPGGTFNVFTPGCPAGTALTGGGPFWQITPGLDLTHLAGTGPSGASWNCAGYNGAAAGAGHFTGTCYAICARLPGR